ncbi:substrate-binding periplasmic protein [Pararhodospirillum oryzae]|uniref:Solute-binding protein family 3/N-terminal domain-containing protein n=1 Tax=Pararhodospirillum oryzae TaxID=478448 RepID=A0A512H6E6_9PROT|nr:ABC transporter substrate-binding protein [Pararhodospirillum oryzae]GEO81023.1 hypothetical protein ROR02_11540 [Pararhodospirillum oryzae]
MRHAGFAIGLGMMVALGAMSGAREARADLLDDIQARGAVRVCIWPDYYSITYRDPRTGVLAGMDIDMARALGQDLGVRVRFVDGSFSTLAESLAQRRCDIAMHAVGVLPSRAAFMDFSEPTLVSGIYAVASRHHPGVRAWEDIDHVGIVVVVQRGTYMEPVMRERLKIATLDVVDGFREREQEVQSGRADVFMTDYPYGRRMADLTDWAVLIAPPQPVAPTPYAYAVPLGEARWLDRVNAFVRQVKADGRLREAARAHGLESILAP